MRRAMQVLHGLGPQETISVYSFPYDHPYFGQLFLAAALGIIGYPSSLLHPTANGDTIHSIEMLWLIPRVLMGLLAVVDTFLIYKIAEVRYNSRKVAFIASVLFAVMPITWLTRRIVLESIQLPFLLLSILFAVYYAKKNSSLTSTIDNEEKNKKNKNTNNNNNKKNIPLVILSGIFLGLAIFTKIPVFTMIPLVGFIIISSSSSATNKNNNQNNNNSKGNSSSTITKRLGRSIITTNLRNLNLKALGIWFIPVILIPAIWPAYNLLTGQFDDWFHGVVSQVGREGSGILQLLTMSFRLDPVLLVLGMIGFMFCTVIKKDLFLLLWIIPFLTFYAVIPYFQHFHFIPILTAFCFSVAILIVDLPRRINRKKPFSEILLPYAIISVVGIFGLISTIMLITTNINSSYFQLYAFIVQYLPDTTNNNNNTRAIIMGSNWMQEFSWIPKYVLHKDHDFKAFAGKNLPVKDKKVLLLVDDKDYKRYILKNEEKITKPKQLYANTREIAKFKGESAQFDYNKYPYTSMKENRAIGRIEIRANY